MYSLFFYKSQEFFLHDNAKQQQRISSIYIPKSLKFRSKVRQKIFAIIWFYDDAVGTRTEGTEKARRLHVGLEQRFKAHVPQTIDHLLLIFEQVVGNCAVIQAGELQSVRDGILYKGPRGQRATRQQYRAFEKT